MNKYIRILISARENIDNGYHISTMTFPPQIFEYNVDLDELDTSASSNDNSFSSNFSSNSNSELGPE